MKKRTLRVKDHVLVIAHPFFGQRVVDDLKKRRHSVDHVETAAQGAKAIASRRPTLLIVDDMVVAPDDAAALRKKASVPLVVMTSKISAEAIGDLVDLSDADEVLFKPFNDDTLKKAIVNALNPVQLTAEERKNAEEERAQRSAERKRRALIAQLTEAQMAAMKPPLRDPREALGALVSWISLRAHEKGTAALSGAQRNLLLVTVLWDHGLSSFTDREAGDAWKETADALVATGFDKGASALRRSFDLLARHGRVDDAYGRAKAREALPGADRTKWDALCAIVDGPIAQASATEKLLAYARTHSKAFGARRRIGKGPRALRA